MALEGGDAVKGTGLAGAIAGARRKAYGKAYGVKKDARGLNAEAEASAEYINDNVDTGGGGGDVSSVFGRDGAVTAQTGDYSVDQITGAQAASEKGQVDGYASLDGDGLVPESQIPSTEVPVDSVFGREGAVTAQTGDYSADQVTNAFNKVSDNSDNVTEGTTNKYYPDSDKSKLAGIDANADVTAENNPKAHADTHSSAGTDPIKLDDLASPEDNTDLDATSSAHGLLPKLSDVTTEFLRGDGAWVAPAGGGGLSYLGTWDADTNSPALSSGSGSDGEYYVVGVSGTTTIDGISDWDVGDWIISNGTTWQKIDNTDVVSSVFGRLGAVTAELDDYTSSQVGNSSEVAGSYVTDALDNIKDSLSVAISAGILASASGQVVDSFTATTDGMCEWVYSLEQDGNVRGGTIVCFWDADSSTARLTDTHPSDIGTVTVSFSVSHDGTDLSLKATNTDTSNAYVFTASRRAPSMGNTGGGAVSTDPTVLQRVDDLTWETAQAGVEYFSPDQHGGIQGKVIRKYYSGTMTGSSLVALETPVNGVWSKLIAVGGNMTDVSGDGNQTSINSYYSTASVVRLSLEYFSPNMELTLRVGSAFYTSGDTYWAFADYTLVTEPTTSPTGQPFADPSSPLLKRVDTGLYEIPQTDTEYESPNKYMGQTARCIHYSVASPTVTSDTAFSVQPSSISRMLFMEGFGTHSSYGVYPIGSYPGTDKCLTWYKSASGFGYYMTNNFSGLLDMWVHYLP